MNKTLFRHSRPHQKKIGFIDEGLILFRAQLLSKHYSTTHFIHNRKRYVYQQQRIENPFNANLCVVEKLKWAERRMNENCHNSRLS